MDYPTFLSKYANLEKFESIWTDKQPNILSTLLLQPDLTMETASCMVSQLNYWINYNLYRSLLLAASSLTHCTVRDWKWLSSNVVTAALYRRIQEQLSMNELSTVNLFFWLNLIGYSVRFVFSLFVYFLTYQL